ncbi:MAG: winged helix-turn-helix domain-containing protein [Elusimicrobia bacterium]|nr:winged helix-turn-helix domain-containing protein [Candidatus Obscuribacterium magneticum]
MAKIFVVHPDPLFQEAYRKILEREGHWVMTLSKGLEASNRLHTHRPDIILLSMNLTDGKPNETINRLRSISYSRPLPIVLIAKNQQLPSLLDLFSTLGVDGVLSEEDLSPVNVSNTVHSLLERRLLKSTAKRFLRYGHLELDCQSRTARLGNALVSDLPKRLFDLLWFLSKRSKDISDRKMIIGKIWRTQVRDRQVDVMVSRLKSRIPFIAPFIRTIPDKGYTLELPKLLSRTKPKNRLVKSI